MENAIIEKAVDYVYQNSLNANPGAVRSAIEKAIVETLKEAQDLALTLRSETQPIDGHSDPGAIEDCWRSLLEILEDGYISLKRNRELDQKTPG